MKRKVPLEPPEENESILSTRKTKSSGGGIRHMERMSGWLKSIATLSVTAATDSSATAVPVIPAVKVFNTTDDKVIDTTVRVKRLKCLPNDMLIRKSITVEANFDLRECIQWLQSRQCVSANFLWKFEVLLSTPDENQEFRSSNYGLNKKTLQGDILWLNQHQEVQGGGRRGVGEERAGDAVRSQVICWQEALESVASMFFNQQTAVFYIIGGNSSFTAVFYQNSISGDDSGDCERMQYECVIHRCTCGLFEELRELRVPLQVLGSKGTVGTSNSRSGGWGKGEGPVVMGQAIHPPPFKEREKLNIFSGSARKSKTNTTDRIIHLSGISTLRAVVDCVTKCCLPLHSSSYYRVAAELPSLVAPAAFSHSTLSLNNPVSLSCTPPSGDQETDAAESFFRDYGQQHESMRTLRLVGDMTSSFIEDLANYLLSSCRGSRKETKLEKEDFNRDIFRIDQSKLKIIDDVAVSSTVLNPFRLSISTPLEGHVPLLRDADKSLHHRGNGLNDSDGPGGEVKGYFKIKLNSTANDFNLSYARTSWNLCDLPHARVHDSLAQPSSVSTIVPGCEVATAVEWHDGDSDDEGGIFFEVSMFCMPQLHFNNILFDGEEY